MRKNIKTLQALEMGTSFKPLGREVTTIHNVFQDPPFKSYLQ